MSEIASTLGDSLTRKLGPLPTWAWFGIPAAGYVAWSYYRASREPDTTASPSIGGSADTPAEDYGINPGGSYLPSYGAAPDGSSNLPAPSVPDFDNESWFRQTSNWLIEEGFVSTDVITALNAYLYGTPEKLTPEQGQALQRGITKFGAAPDPAFVPTIEEPTPTPTPTPEEGNEGSEGWVENNISWISGRT